MRQRLRFEERDLAYGRAGGACIADDPLLHRSTRPSASGAAETRRRLRAVVAHMGMRLEHEDAAVRASALASLVALAEGSGAEASCCWGFEDGEGEEDDAGGGESAQRSGHQGASTSAAATGKSSLAVKSPSKGRDPLRMDVIRCCALRLDHECDEARCTAVEALRLLVRGDREEEVAVLLERLHPPAAHDIGGSSRGEEDEEHAIKTRVYALRALGRVAVNRDVKVMKAVLQASSAADYRITREALSVLDTLTCFA